MDQFPLTLALVSKEVPCAGADNLRLAGLQKELNISNRTHLCDPAQLYTDSMCNDRILIQDSAHEAGLHAFFTTAACSPFYEHDRATEPAYNEALETQFTQEELDTACQTGGRHLTPLHTQSILKQESQYRGHGHSTIDDVLSNDGDSYGADADALCIGDRLYQCHLTTLLDLGAENPLITSCDVQCALHPTVKTIESRIAIRPHITIMGVPAAVLALCSGTCGLLFGLGALACSRWRRAIQPRRAKIRSEYNGTHQDQR